MTVGAIEALLSLDAQLVQRVPDDPLDPDADLVDLVVGVTKCELQQTTAGEEHEGRVLTTGWRVFLPADVELTGWDVLLVDGERLEVDGDPWPVRHPREGTVHHVEAAVRRSR